MKSLPAVRVSFTVLPPHPPLSLTNTALPQLSDRTADRSTDGTLGEFCVQYLCETAERIQQCGSFLFTNCSCIKEYTANLSAQLHPTDYPWDLNAQRRGLYNVLHR